MKNEILKNPKISIIVTARNYGKFIADCLLSCLNQTVKPFEVIYADDYSEDDSLEIAYMVPGVIVTRQMRHVGVVKARNCGVAKSSGDILVHVDGDDILPPDFLEKHLEVFDETTPFTYCAAQCFGLKETFYNAPEWDERFIFDRNYVNTSTMMWRWVFEKAGGWQETSLQTMWDWSLAIRASRVMKTPPKKSPAVLKYRQHDYSWSIKKKKQIPDYNIQHQKIRKEMATMSICCVYGGRLPDLFFSWMEQLVNDIQILENKPELIIINNDKKETFEYGRIFNVLNASAQFFSKVFVVRGRKPREWDGELDRRKAVAELLADSHNLALESCSGDLIHFREDDIIPKIGAFELMYEFIMDITGKPKKAAVSGLYLNRHINRPVGGFYDPKNPHTEVLPPSLVKPIAVDFTGTGCILYWRALCPQVWKPMTEGDIAAHDWRFGMDLNKMAKDIYILPSAVCKHYHGWDYVEPNPLSEVTILNHCRPKMAQRLVESFTKAKKDKPPYTKPPQRKKR